MRYDALLGRERAMLTISSVWLAPSVPVILDESPKLAHHLPLCISASESARAEGGGEREREMARSSLKHTKAGPDGETKHMGQLGVDIEPVQVTRRAPK